MNRRRFLSRGIALAAAAAAGVHKLDLGKVLAENVAVETKAPDVEALTEAELLRAGRWARDIQALIDMIGPVIDAIASVDDLEFPADIETWCWDGKYPPRYELPPEHPQCPSSYSANYT